MAAISETVAVFNVMTRLATPVAHFAVVVAPCMNGPIANGDLGSAASLAFEVGGLVHVAVNATMNASYSVSSGEVVRTLIHGQAFVLKGLLQSSDAVGNLAGLGMVSMEILNFTL